MALGLLRVDLLTNGTHSLKEKRRVILSLKERLRNRFNISVAETDYYDLWQRSQLSIACISADGRTTKSILTRVGTFIKNEPEVILLKEEMEEIR